MNCLALLSSLWSLRKVNYANSVWFLSIFWIAGLSNATCVCVLIQWTPDSQYK